MLSDSKRWTEDLSEVEFERLKSYEYAGRVNEVFLEAFDFWTDLGLVAVLWVYSQPDVSISYDDPIIGVLTSSGFSQCDIGTTPPERDAGLFYSLFVAALVILIMNTVVRAGIAVYRITRIEPGEMPAVKKYVYYLIGIVATVVSPHNGLFFLDTIVGRGTLEKDVIVFTKREIQLDALLLSMEDFPQFVIQVIFFSSVASGDVPIAFWLSTIVTILSIFIEVGGIVINVFKLRGFFQRDEAAPPTKNDEV